MIRDHSVHGRSNEPMNPCPEWINHLGSLILIRIIPKERTLSSVPKGVSTSGSEIYGLVTLKSDLPHRYSVFGVSELVKVSSDATIPVRMVNPPAQPVKIFCRTNFFFF